MIWLWAVSLIWGFSFGLIKVSFAGFDPFLLGALRLALALVAFLPFLRLRGLTWSRGLSLLAIGAVQYGLMYASLFASFGALAGFQVAVLTVTTPLFVVLWDQLFRARSEWRDWLTALVAVAGATIIVWEPHNGSLPWTGILLVQVANLAFAFGQVAYTRWHRSNPGFTDEGVYALPYFGGAVFLALLTLGTGGWAEVTTLSLPQWGALAYLGVVASGLGFFGWNRGARQVATSQLAVMNNLKIPVAVVLSIIFFGEKPVWLTLTLGSLVLVAALVWKDRVRS